MTEPGLPAIPAGYNPAALAVAAAAHTAQLRPANTAAAWAADWDWWTKFCDGKGIPIATADSALMAAYAHWLWHEHEVPLATARRRLTGATAGLRDRLGDAAVPRSLTTMARKNLTAYARQAADDGERHRGAERGKAPAATVDVLTAMVDTCDTSLAGLRDRALLLVSFACAARRGETAGLLAGDITVESAGLVVDVRTTKRLSSQRQVAVPYSAHPDRCPVRAWTAWRTAAGLDNGDPAFTPINRHGHMTLARLSPQAVGDIITRRAEAAGATERLTGHSLRAGLATEARRAGKDLTAIARQGGWSPASRDLHGYIRTIDRWDDNAAAGVL